MTHARSPSRTLANARRRRKLAFFGVLWNVVDLVYLLLLGGSIGLWLYIIADPVVRNLQITETSVTVPGGQPVNFASTSLAGREVQQDFALQR